MKIAIGYPSLDDPRGFHQTGQNRQAQIFAKPAFIYPYIMAMAATLAKQNGHDVFWSDGPAEGLTWEQQLQQLITFQPDIVMWEVKTPSVIGTWRRVNELKHRLPDTKVVLCGDHVTALPKETLDQSKTDIVLTGGDYDFGLMVILKQSFQQGIFQQPTTSDLKTLPVVDRNLSKWWLYGYGNGSGNYRLLPGTHNMIGRDCWWRKDGGCTFCSWTNTFPNWRCGTVDQFMAEIENCASLGIREVFDDTGTFPVAPEWFDACCAALTKFNHGKRHGKCRVTIGCNMRPGALTREQYQQLGAAGFRFILYGLESANQSTLDRINKGQNPGDMEQSVKWATQAGLDPHATCMVGYPYESKSDAYHTIDFTRYLFRKGYIKTLQATICIPYPGTQLFKQCVENEWLKYPVGDWDKWDMRRPIMKSPFTDEELLKLVRSIYTSFLTPQYIFRQLRSIRRWDDLRFIGNGLRHLKGHLLDFSGSGKTSRVMENDA